MLDREVVERKLRELSGYVRELKSLRSLSFEEFRTSVSLQWAVQHGLQLAVQTVLDVGNHILAALGENNIDEYADIIDRLGEQSILPADFAGAIRSMAGFRNILVHEYAAVDPKQVYEVLQNRLEDFVEFGKYIQKYLKGTAPN